MSPRILAAALASGGLLGFTSLAFVGCGSDDPPPPTESPALDAGNTVLPDGAVVHIEPDGAVIPVPPDSGVTPPPHADGGEAGVSSAWLHTSGNAILHSDGTRFHGKGADLEDTRSCDACLGTQNPAEVNRRMDALISWGGNFIRLLLESDTTADTADKSPAYLADLKTIVAHAASKNVYVMLSLWQDPNVTAQGWPTAAATPEWTALAKAFANEPYVLFAMANEPQSNADGAQDAQVWKIFNDLAGSIRTAETAAGAPQQHIVVAQGTRSWSRYVDYYLTHPITAGGGTNIAYETHVYNPQADFAGLFGTASKTIPVIIGEFGPASNFGASMTIDDVNAMITLAKQLEVPFLAFDFHMRCPPNLLVDHSNNGCGIGMTLDPTPDWGVPFKAALSQPW